MNEEVENNEKHTPARFWTYGCRFISSLEKRLGSMCNTKIDCVILCLQAIGSQNSAQNWQKKLHAHVTQKSYMHSKSYTCTKCVCTKVQIWCIHAAKSMCPTLHSNLVSINGRISTDDIIALNALHPS